MSTTPRPILVFIRGLPGSGKSYLTQHLADQYDSSAVVVLDPDATDHHSPAYKEHSQRLTDEGVDSALHPYRFLRAQAFEAIQNDKIILWNQPFTNRETFRKVTDKMQSYAREHNKDLAILIVEVEVDPGQAKQRVDERKATGGHGPSDTTFSRFSNDYASFADEGFPSISVNGAAKIDESVEKVAQKITDCLSFV